MYTWLRKPDFHHLGLFENNEETPSTLNPLLDESFEFMCNLYKSLLPHFSSEFVNIGLDEAYGLGRFQSAEACKEKGKGQVFMDWLNKLNDHIKENYGKKISDLSNVMPLDSGYGTAFSYAAAEQVDIIVCYADGRNDYEASWMLPVDQQDETGKQGMGRSASIWEELNVIGVTDGIYNDTVAVSKASQYYTPELIAALQQCFINIINTEEGKAIFDVYSHAGYAVAQDSDYDGARAALDLVS